MSDKSELIGLVYFWRGVGVCILLVLLMAVVKIGTVWFG